MKNSVVILGVGGHGWESLSYFFDSAEKMQFFLYSQTTDWGGFTGLLGRLLEINDKELNIALHKKIIPFLPWGDLNKRLVYYMSKRFGQQVGSTLDFRSYHIWEIKAEFEILSDFLALDNSVISHFHTYLEVFFEYLSKHSDKLPYTTPVCLGTLWNQYLYWQINGLENWNLFYKQKNILPQNINFFFTSSFRTSLNAVDLNNKIISGEDEIDKHQIPITASTLEINSVESDNTESICDLEMITKLQMAGLVIIPNGSIANWLPFLNIPEIKNILQEKSKSKKLIWLLNLFHTKNEQAVDEYVSFVNSLEIYPIIIGPKDLPEKIPLDILEKYKAENKFLNLKNNEEVEKLYKTDQNVIFELECDINEVFKYSPRSVSNSILKILHEK